MKIAFLWYFNKASSVFDKWHDGLKAAIDLISKEHTVHWYLDKELPPDDYDAIIFWDDSNSTFFDKIGNYHAKKAICLTTWPHNFNNLRLVDAVYCESDQIYEMVRREGIRAIKAFGTDTAFFKPDPHIKKDIEYFYPATFSPWKKQSDIAYLGKKLTAVGTVQPDGASELLECHRRGVNVITEYLPVRRILDFYLRSKHVIIPAVHGSERTVLEAMACNIKPEVTNKENVRANSYILEMEESGLGPRDFTVENYSHINYAKQILRGLS